MNKNLVPGKYVKLFTHMQNSDKPSVCLTMIHQVFPGSLIVADHASGNGVGKIGPDARTEELGSYWYSACGRTVQLVRLEDCEGNQIKLGQFLDPEPSQG